MRNANIILFYFGFASISTFSYTLILTILNGSGFNIFSLNKEFNVTIIIVGLATSIIVATSEELIFRGILLNYLLDKFNTSTALFIQSTLFAATHIIGSLIQRTSDEVILALYFVNMFAGGILLGVIYLREKTLIAPISFHLAWNFTAYNLLGLSNQPSLMTIFTRENIYYGKFEKDLLTFMIFIFLLIIIIKSRLRS